MDHNQEQVLNDLKEIGIGSNECHVKGDIPNVASPVIIIPSYKLGYLPNAEASSAAITLNIRSNQLLNKCWWPVDKLNTINYKGTRLSLTDDNPYSGEEIVFKGKTYYPYSMDMSPYIIGNSGALKELLCIARGLYLGAI